jgi:hypothetical protein
VERRAPCDLVSFDPDLVALLADIQWPMIDASAG